MGLELKYSSGQTPLSEEEKEGLLLDTITTVSQLNEFEQQNINKAEDWIRKRKFKLETILSEDFSKLLHKQMFSDVWNWAGSFRHSNKNLGVEWIQVPIEVKNLNDDCKFWIEHKTYPEDEIAIRYKHRIVSIHPFPNGNGRHSRMIADIIISKGFNKKAFTWGGSTLVNSDSTRREYINALKEADEGNIQPLLKFARS